MKTITQPAQRESAEYYSDFSGELIDFPIAPAQITFEFNYGSKYDESKITFDLSDQEAEDVLGYFRKRLSARTRQVLSDKIKVANRNFDDNIQARDWASADYFDAQALLLKALLSPPDKKAGT